MDQSQVEPAAKQPKAGAGLAKFGSFASLAVVVLTLAVAGAVSIYLPPRLSKIFDDFDSKMPTITVAFVTFPVWGYALVFAAVIGLLIIKEWLIADKRITMSINFVVMLATLVYGGVLVVALYAPIIALMQSLT
jgi:hypothetical protein